MTLDEDLARVRHAERVAEIEALAWEHEVAAHRPSRGLRRRLGRGLMRLGAWIAADGLREWRVGTG